MSKVNRKKKEIETKSGKVETTTKNMKIRRCEIRLRRFKMNENSSANPSVPLQKETKTTQILKQFQKKKQNSVSNVSSAALLEKTPIEKSSTLSNETNSCIKINGDKLPNPKKADGSKEPLNKSRIKQLAEENNNINTLKKYKTRKCVVKIKRIKEPQGNNTNKSKSMNTLQERSNVLTASKPFQTKKCVVKLKRIKENASTQNNNSILKQGKSKASKPEIVGKNVSFHPLSSNISFEDEMVVTEFELTKSTSPRNLVNRPNDISELLLCDDDEELLKSPTNMENQTKKLENLKNIENEKSENTNKTIIKNKFFHKNKENLQENRENKKQKIKKSKSIPKTRKTSKTKQTAKKDTFAKNDDIYEFLSQSQNSDSDAAKDKDVAADIIQKLIEQGKVDVTKNRKGRPIITHKNRRIKKITLQTKKMETENKNSKHINTIETHNDDDDIFHDYEDIAEQPEISEIPVITSDNSNLQKQNIVKENQITDEARADGTFSSLARSVLVRQMENQEAARKKLTLQRYNSTPFKPQQKSPQAQLGAELSPIRQIINEKLKRLNEAQRTVESLQDSIQDEQPTFSGNVINQSIRRTFGSPSFSLQSPRREEQSLQEEQPTFSGKSNAKSTTNETTTRRSSIFNNLSFSLLTSEPNNSKQQQQTQKNSLSSFSSNDSNAENQPPPKISSSSLQTQNNIGIENDFIHSARQTPNPRRTLLHRSPLKAINIIDVVSLPPYTGPTSKTTNEILKDKTKDEEDSKLFGFEEYLDTNETTENETLPNETSINENSLIMKTSKANLSKHLKKLKQWRPKLNPLKGDDSNNTTTITSNFFDDEFYNKTKRNRNIKDMLCSTMIDKNKNQISKENLNKTSNTLAAENINVNDEDDSDDSDFERSKEKVTAELFGDPETSFDHKQAHRTYQRPFKRKRKLIHQFSEIFESDEEHSDEDDEAHNKSIIENKQRKTKKRQCRAESPVNQELEEFVNKFNSELKEAEDYELLVE